MKITGGAVQIDEGDYSLVSGRKWHVNDSGYAVWRGTEDDGVKRTIRMHRLILNTPKGMMTDHINHDRLDNRRANIRICTQSENMRNMTDQGKGYNWHRQNNRWNVETNGQRLSGFLTEEAAIAVVELIRSGGTYERPQRTECIYGHSLEDAYDYGKGKNCKQCQSKRSREYHERKTQRSSI